MLRRRSICVLFGASVLAGSALAESAARADEPVPVRPKNFEEEYNQPWTAGVPPWRLKQHQRWRVWDPYFDPREALLSPAYIVQNMHGGEKAWGVGLSYGQSIQTYRGPLFVRGQIALAELRIHDKSLFALSGMRWVFTGGLALGPLEIGAGPGVTAMHFDFERWRPSFGALSPRISAFVGLKLGVVRVAVEAYSEVYWRWIGQDSARIHGFVLDLGGGGRIDAKSP